VENKKGDIGTEFIQEMYRTFRQNQTFKTSRKLRNTKNTSVTKHCTFYVTNYDLTPDSIDGGTT